MGDLNKQLARLEARVKGAENAINGHVLALSQLTDALSSNPLTMDVGAVGKLFYNGTVGGFQVLLDLVGDSLPSFDNITNLKAEALVKAAEQAAEQAIKDIEQQLEDAVASMIDQLNNMIDGYVQQLESYTQQISDLAKKIEDAATEEEKASLMTEKEAAEKMKGIAEKGLESAQATIQNVISTNIPGLKINMLDFLKSQKNLRKGVSQSLDILTGL